MDTAMAYSPSHVANFFLTKGQEEGVVITPLKLQKLVYIGYGWVLAVLQRRLFEESIAAWDHGPVIESLYHEFKHFGRNPIDVPAAEYDWETGSAHYPSIPDGEQDVRVVLDKVWEVYKGFSAWTLRNLTHQDDSPWKGVYGTHEPIPDALIEEHFRSKIKQYIEAAHA